MNLKVLLLEPNYANKYPPMGLMKIAMYHRIQKDDVRFFKGNFSDFLAEEYAQIAVSELEFLDRNLFNWKSLIPQIIGYVKKLTVIQESELAFALDNDWVLDILDRARKGYRTHTLPLERKFDRVYITTLFTFYWDITIKTIEYAKKCVKNKKNVMVGGVLATVAPEAIEKETGIKPHCGVISTKFIANDPPIDCIIDELPLDYSILEEIDYKYPAVDAYYGYATRGCVNRCKFCAVPILEPEYKDYISLKTRIEKTKIRFGEQRDLLLLDNNVFASKEFDRIIDEICECGFEKGAKYIPPNPLEIVVNLLKSGWNDRAYIRKSISILKNYLDRLKNEEYTKLYDFMLEHELFSHYTAKKEDILECCRMIGDAFNKSLSKKPIVRHVDFNQGVDARLASKDRLKSLSRVAIKPLRVAFDDWKLRKYYVQALYNAQEYGIRQMSNYLLYNFMDTPEELYDRLLLNIDLCTALDINIYSFPMKYHPIFDEAYFKNRDYLGKNWSRKQIRTIQCILNSTKGKVGRGRTFFFAAFGRNLDEFRELLLMPELYIIKRYDAELSGATNKWRRAFNRLSIKGKEEAKTIIWDNIFTKEKLKNCSEKVANFLWRFYSDENSVKAVSSSEKKDWIEEFSKTCPVEISSECRKLLDEVSVDKIK